MALKKSKTAPAATEQENESATEMMTPEEHAAAQENMNDQMNSGANSERLRLASALMCRTFNIPEDFRITKFNDKGKVIDLTLEGDDFIVSVTIKNSEAHPGLMPQ